MTLSDHRSERLLWAHRDRNRAVIKYRGEVGRAHDAGATIYELAKLLGVSESAIRSVITTYERTKETS